MKGKRGKVRRTYTLYRYDLTERVFITDAGRKALADYKAGKNGKKR